MLRLHSSNRYSVLVEQLCVRLDETGGGPFAADEIVVPSAAVRRSLTLAIADRDGICANVRFDFLAHWIWRQIGRLLPALRGESPFATDALSWRLFAALADRADRDGLDAHPRLARYLAGSDDVMRFELASRIAALFEQYATYRPEWTAAWLSERLADLGSDDAAVTADQRWQAELWRRVVADLPSELRNPAPAIAAALRRLDTEAATRAGLPPAVHLFALPTMPPLHLAWLSAIAAAVDVDVYVLNPCREYWYEVVDPKRLAALQARGKASAHEVGNRLLAAWGRQTQSHLGLLAAGVGDAVEVDRFVPRRATTLLATLQDSILDLTELGPGSVRLDAADRSIEIHVCHSLTRELEVLQDHLLGLFAAPDSTLRPADILVVTPDLDQAAPLVEAIFGTAPADRFIPYAVSGRARTQVNAPAQALLAVLALAGSRFRLGALLELLHQPIVARAWDLDDAALAQVAEWLQGSGSRWGLDAEHRAGFDVPALARHTLADGLDRLFLGYALPDDVEAPFAELLPSGPVEGTGATLLGVLWRCIETLRTLQAAVAQPRLATAWSALLLDAIATFTQPIGDEIEDARELQLVVRQLGNDMQSAGAEPIGLAVVTAALRRAIDDPTRGGVAGGGVTFSSMASLRNLPFAVVCAIGMNDGAFPSGRSPLEIDLMAARPRPGDRQRRDDERNLFLDLLLAAERSVYISYVGRSVRDNAGLPPSVLVAELLDVVVPAIATVPATAADLITARSRLLVEHPLQPFAAEPFLAASDPRLRSFDRELAEALQRSLDDATRDPTPASVPTPGGSAADDAFEGEGEDEVDAALADVATRPFFSAPLPSPGDEWRAVTLARLERFFRQPSRDLLLRRLGIDLPRSGEIAEDDEPFLPDRLCDYALARQLLAPLLAGASTAAVRRLAEAGIDVPQGAIGRQYLDAQLASLQSFAARVLAATHAEVLSPVRERIELDVDGQRWSLDAGFSDLRPSGLVRWEYDVLRARHVIAAWLAHLALCAIAPAGVEPRTRWLSLDAVLDLAPVADARGHLQSLLGLYRDGLVMPLHFFPKSAWVARKGGHEDREAAERAWRVTRSAQFAEGVDAGYRLALRGDAEPLDDTFYANAERFFAPVLAHATLESVEP